MQKESSRDFEGIEDITAEELTEGEIEHYLELADSSDLWNLKIIKACNAFEIIKNKGEGVNIAVLDSGIWKEHPRLVRSYKEMVDISKEEGLGDHLGHGTSVCGVISGEGISIATKASIYDIIFFSKIGGEYMSGLLRKGIDWCIFNEETRIDIINISIGYPAYKTKIHDLCKKANEEGIVVIASAGNRYTGASFPASHDSVISVGAIDESGKPCPFSSLWPTVDVVAPGKNIFSTYHSREKPGCIYRLANGTSFAAPHVTGIVALAISELKKQGEEVIPDKIKQALKETAVMEEDYEYARGIAKIYDPERVLLRNEEITMKCIVGAGLVQADEFVRKFL